jgi:hypothetical protein
VKQITQRLTFSNVMSAIAVFLVLGGTAFAASQLKKNSVGTKQLKKNAVTQAKIKNGAVTGAKLGADAVTETKIANGAVTGAKLADGAVAGAKLADGAVSGGKIQNGAITGDKVADGSLTGADINSGSTSFSQIVARLRNPGPLNLQVAGSHLLGSYTQAPGENDIFFAGIDVNFLPTCAPPRSAVVYLLIDPANPAVPTAENIVSLATASDGNPGPVTKRLEFPESPFGFQNSMRRMGTATAQPHSLYLYLASGSCNSGSGITGTNAGLDVLGTK